MIQTTISFEDYIDEDDGWLLLERQTINDRTLLCWYSPTKGEINIAIFNLVEPINSLAKRSSESQWGWMTHFIENIKTEIEATEVVNLYLKDMQTDNYWWEKL